MQRSVPSASHLFGSVRHHQIHLLLRCVFGQPGLAMFSSLNFACSPDLVFLNRSLVLRYNVLIFTEIIMVCHYSCKLIWNFTFKVTGMKCLLKCFSLLSSVYFLNPSFSCYDENQVQLVAQGLQRTGVMGPLTRKIVTLSAVADSSSRLQIRISGPRWYLLNWAAFLVERLRLFHLERSPKCLCVLGF